MDALAAALESGRATPPHTRSELQPLVGVRLAEPVAAELSRLAAEGMRPAHTAHLLRLLAAERGDAQDSRERVELVWTVEGSPGATGRDTAVVVRELFAAARKNVLIVSYALDRGAKASTLFGPLAARLDSEPGLAVRVCVNIHGPVRGTYNEAQVVGEFGKLFRKEIWPGSRLPEVFYDPRSLRMGGGQRACQHAKCVAIDGERVLITSANFTEAAHHRNIEVGVVLGDPAAALGVQNQFDNLIRNNRLLPLPRS